MEEVAVIAPQYFPQGNQLCGGRVADPLFDLAECACADGYPLQLQLCHQVHVPQAFLLPQAADVKADDGRAALSDPFGFVYKASSEADPGTVKEITALIHKLLLFFYRQALEHILIVRVCHGCAFDKGKEPEGDPLIPQIVEQVPAGCKDACFVIPKGRVEILEFHKAIPAGIKDQKVSAVYLTECIRNPLAGRMFLIADAQLLSGCLSAELIFKPVYFILPKSSFRSMSAL